MCYIYVKCAADKRFNSGDPKAVYIIIHDALGIRVNYIMCVA